MTDSGGLDGIVLSWERSLRARNRSQATIDSYLLCVRLLFEYLKGATPVPEIRRSDVEGFIAEQLETRAANTAGIRYRSLAQFFKWLLAEGEIDVNPMAHMEPPSVPEIPVPVLSDDAIRGLLDACDGRGFTERRDAAIIRLFIDTPCRLSEVTNLKVEDVDLQTCVLRVLAKGSKVETKPFGPKSLVALDRYLRVRPAHKYASNPRLWLGPKGPMTRSGVDQMLERRSKQAGIPVIHAHQFRHTWAHNWKVQGGRDEDLMQLAGWSSPQMLRRYGASLADQRAKDAYRSRNPGERI